MRGMAETINARPPSVRWRRPAAWMLAFLGLVLLVKGVDSNLWGMKEIDRQHFGLLYPWNTSTPRQDTAESNRAAFAASLQGIVLVSFGTGLIGVAVWIWRPWRTDSAKRFFT
jgi:hypothetical protein